MSKTKYKERKRLVKTKSSGRIPIKFLGILSLFIFLIIGVMSLKRNDDNQNGKFKKKIQVHYIARYTTVSDTGTNTKSYRFAKLHEIALKHYFKQLEKFNSEIQFEIQTHDNKSNPKNSVDIYKKIAAQKKSIPVIVIDNTWGKHIKACANIIKENNIPAININADHYALGYGKNVVFIANDDNSPLILSKFISKVLKQDSINFISEVNYDLDTIYRKQFSVNDIKIATEIKLRSTDSIISREDSMNFIKEFKEKIFKYKGKIIVMNVHTTWGTFIRHFINSELDSVRVACPIYSTSTLIDSLNPNKANEFITVASSDDAISQRITDDFIYFRHCVDSTYFLAASVHEFINRCYTATNLVHEIVKHSKTVSSDIFAEIIRNLPNTPIISKDDILKFSIKGGAIELNRDRTFSLLKKGRLNAYPKQLNEDGDVIPNLFFGMEIENIYDLNLKEGSFKTDFYYWLKVDSTFDNVDSLVNFENLKIESKSELVKRKMKNSRFVYKLYKIDGVCYQKFNLEKYPIDEYQLHISTQIIDPTSEIRISFDQESTIPEEEFTNRINFEGWKVSDYHVTVDNRVTKSSRGLTFSNNEFSNKYKTMTFWINIKRKSIIPVLGIILPLIIIGLISIGTLFLREYSFSVVGQTTSGLLVSTVLYLISLAELTPTSDVLKKSDLIFWITLLVVLVSFILPVFYSSVFFKENRKPIITRHIGWALLVFYPLTILYVIFIK